MTSEVPAFSPETRIKTVDLHSAGIQRIVYADRPGDGPALLCLHGLGSTKQDFAPLTHHSGLSSRRIVAWDAPGSGSSPYPRTLTIRELCDLVMQLVASLGLDRPILVGHSMGGLTALLVARAHPGSFTGFVNLEGNLTPEDCGVFSRTASSMSFERFEGRFFPWLQVEFERSRAAGYAEFAQRFRDNVSERTFWDYCRSIVDLSDTEPLLSDFRALSMPCIYVYGSENRNLPAAVLLRGTRVGMEEVPRSNHFPLYSNPAFLLNVLSRFCERSAASCGVHRA